ncbi:MAG TPA: hypothetical protein VE109_07950 [Acidobacteriaceae bacterium]|nr:hypothetical protein [Acidobacteriaceae bacterium]
MWLAEMENATAEVTFWTLLPALEFISISSVAKRVDINGRIWAVVPGMGLPQLELRVRGALGSG